MDALGVVQACHPEQALRRPDGHSVRWFTGARAAHRNLSQRRHCRSRFHRSYFGLTYGRWRQQTSAEQQSMRTPASLMSTHEAANQQASSTKACVALTYGTVDEMLSAAKEAQSAGADLVEIRLDCLTTFDPANDIPRLIAELPLPCIMTLRPTWEGGFCELPEPRRLAALKYAASLGAAYVDIEYKVASYFFEGYEDLTSAPTQFIISSHNFETTPPMEDLEDHVRRCSKLISSHFLPNGRSPIIKLVVTARDASDALSILGLTKRTVAGGQPMIGLAMGEAGLPSRLLAGTAGAFLTFATLHAGRASAPGQPPLQEVLQRYHLREQHPDTTQIWGVVGDPVAHSKGPIIHNAMLQSAGIDGVYVALRVLDFPAFLRAKERSGIHLSGLSVTIPHKGAALAAADMADPLASAIGAANTLVWDQQGRCKAFNTDAKAAISAIEQALVAEEPGEERSTAREDTPTSHTPLKGKRVIIVGAGGAGRAVAMAAAQAGAIVTICNRTASKADELAAGVSSVLPDSTVSAAPLQSVQSGEITGDVLANTTQIGMYPQVDASPVPADALHNYSVVFDAVYTPLYTRLLQDAEAAGCTVVTGDKMFLGQAAEQFRLFTGKEPDVLVMQDALGLAPPST